MSQASGPEQPKNAIVITALAVVVLFAGIIYFGWPYLSVLNNPEQTRNLINQAGVYGPLVFILLQVAQVLIAPVPGQVMGLAGGYLFGPLLGLLYTMIGATIGFTLIFILTRKLGRPFVAYFVSQKVLRKFDHLIDKSGVWVFFLIFLLPAFPDDMISFIAGLTTIKIPTLVLISLAGRLPGYAILTFTGDGLAGENINHILVTTALLVIIFGLAWWKREWLRQFTEHENRILFIKEQWNAVSVMYNNFSLTRILYILFLVATIIALFIVYKNIDSNIAFKFLIGYLLFSVFLLFYVSLITILNSKKLRWAELRKRILRFLIYFILLGLLNYLLDYTFRPSHIDLLRELSIACGLAFGITFMDVTFLKKENRLKKID